jgi:leucyl-tRNA synthetase
MVWRWNERLASRTTVNAVTEPSVGTRALRRKTHQTIAKVTGDFEDLHLNTIVAALMELFNEISAFEVEPATATEAEVFAVKEALEALVLMLAPFSPHAAEEMWQHLGHPGGLLNSGRWPQADPELAQRDELEIPVQVNGKLRSRVLALPEVTEEELRQAALSDEKIRAFIEGHEVVKVIVVPQRLVNVVVR